LPRRRRQERDWIEREEGPGPAGAARHLAGLPAGHRSRRPERRRGRSLRQRTAPSATQPALRHPDRFRARETGL